MSDADLTTSVGQYVVERPSRARVFERLGISLEDCRRVLEESADDVRELIQILRG